jgi:hypothetical protein
MIKKSALYLTCSAALLAAIPALAQTGAGSSQVESLIKSAPPLGGGAQKEQQQMNNAKKNTPNL